MTVLAQGLRLLMARPSESVHAIAAVFVTMTTKPITALAVLQLVSEGHCARVRERCASIRRELAGRAEGAASAEHRHLAAFGVYQLVEARYRRLCWLRR